MSYTRKNYSEWAKDCYSPDFNKRLSPLTKKLTLNKCVLCGKTARITHHAYYTEKGGGDKPGVNLFPLCKSHHRQAHSPANWKKTSRDPVTGRANTAFFLDKLREGWKKYALRQNKRHQEVLPVNVNLKLSTEQYTAGLFAVSLFTALIVIIAR